MELDKLLLSLGQGKKIRRNNWNSFDFIWLKDGRIVGVNNHPYDSFAYITNAEQFELYLEKVPFMTAFQAFKDGKTIRRIDRESDIYNYVYFKVNDYSFTIKDIESEWYILD